MARPKGRQHPYRLSVSLDERAYAQLCAIARQGDVSAAWVVRRAVHDFIARNDTSEMAELPLVRRVMAAR